MTSSTTPAQWELTPQAKEQEVSGFLSIFDATAREKYSDSHIPEKLRLPILMCKMWDMRQTLDAFYIAFHEEHSNFRTGLHTRTTSTMPMLTVMQDAEHLTWASSARTAGEATKEKQRELAPIVHELARKLGGKAFQEKRLAALRCGEQGCLNRIALERQSEQNPALPPSGALVQQDLLDEYKSLNIRCLSLGSNRRLADNRGSIAWSEDGTPKFRGCCTSCRYCCAKMLGEIGAQDLYVDGNIDSVIESQSRELECYRKASEANFRLSLLSDLSLPKWKPSITKINDLGQQASARDNTLLHESTRAMLKMKTNILVLAR
ncbi:hypothetical protein MMC13_004913 [Lambiella insularis]|nr:hypothetical protein [Lambiella insularis]